MPHLAVDPVPVACEIGVALHAMVTRRGNAFDPIVLTCGKIAGGTASNIIPETVEMLGTLRTTSEAARDHAHQGIRRVATNIAAAHLCEGEVDIKRGYPVTVNDAGFVDFARRIATELVGEDYYIPMPAPFMGAEDFSYVLQRMPGCGLILQLVYAARIDVIADVWAGEPGQARAAHVRRIVWRRSCDHGQCPTLPPRPQHGVGMPVLDWAARLLRCTECGAQDADFIV